MSPDHSDPLTPSDPVAPSDPAAPAVDPTDPIDVLDAGDLARSAGEPRTRVVVFGDVLDDVIVTAATPAAKGTDTEALIRHRAGGAAANTAAWLGSLGGEVDFVGRVGVSDRHRHAQLLADAGVLPRLSYDAHDPTGTVVITVEGEVSSMFTDRGASAALDPDDVPDELLESAAVLHVTGYSVVHSRTPVPLRRLMTRAREAGVAVSVDPGSSGFIGRFGVAAFLDAIEGADLFFASPAEGRLLTGLDDEHGIATALAERFGVVCLVQDDGGAVLARHGRSVVDVPSVTTRVVDPVGVGDAFAAGFIDSWRTTRKPGVAARRGARAAARAFAVAGGRPPA
ncbi:carbohydrate kinase family protein [Frigoribacterium sp. CFBP9030]|uniref:carbohydrate kinase family protein n=1 Tax=Frigoribacterium sp. CFBP9030 TaxID=3096537 RepID=UPI002A69C8DA|nr:PfkB family carbohydrate kinase [Frigoribacterium sp. CFBP9030]MDY0892107.1 PfkB family carbohydrate kinase [Frigoribacterium sp. CFBP9030]